MGLTDELCLPTVKDGRKMAFDVRSLETSGGWGSLALLLRKVQVSWEVRKLRVLHGSFET